MRALLVVALNLLLAIAAHHTVLRGFANSADEYAQLTSARLFAEGRLAVPSPEPRNSFDFHHILNEGRYYGKYAPGWPALLAVGVKAGVPWLVNPLLVSFALLLMWRIAAENASNEIANVALLLAAFNPYLVFNAASYFVHPSALFFATLAVFAYFRCRSSPPAPWAYLLFGAAGGATFLIRPYTAIALLAPFAIALLVSSVREERGRAVPRLLAASAPALAFLGLFLLYNDLQTGDPFLQPFAQYDPTNTVGRTSTSEDYAWALSNNLGARLRDLNTWMPLTVVLLAVHAFRDKRGLGSTWRMLWLGPVCLLGAFFFFLFDPGNEYGPRYLFESVSLLLILTAMAVAASGRLRAVLVVGILVWNAGMLVVRSAELAHEIEERTELYEVVREHGLSNAIVFLRTGSGSMPPKDLTRNGIHFDQPVLYVRDLGHRNERMLRYYPDRLQYTWEYDEQSGEGRLTRR